MKEFEFAEPPEVSVIIVSYNALEWLAKSLAALAALNSRRTIEIILVDNNSAADVQEYLAQASTVRVLQQSVNLGFGRACNLGVLASSGRYVLLLNPDAIVQPDAIDALADFLELDPTRGLVGGRTLRPDGSLDPSSSWAAPSVWSLFCAAVGLTAAFRRSRLFDPEAMGKWDRLSERDVDIVTGCLLMLSRSTWDLLGGFDPEYFMYGEDIDLSLRAWAAGFHPGITPGAVVIHAVGASSPNRLAKQRLLLRGKATLIRKRWSTGRRMVGYSFLALGVGLRAVLERARGSEDHTMRTLWSERREWLAGWPAVPSRARQMEPGGSD